MLIRFSNGIRGAKRLTAPKALGDSDNDMSCHARNYGTGRTRFQLQFPIAVCERLITAQYRLLSREIEFELSLAIGNIHAAEFPHPYCQSRRDWLRQRESGSFAHAHAPPLHRQSGNGEMQKDMLRKCVWNRTRARSAADNPFPRLHLTVRGGSLGARIAPDGLENRPRCLRRLVQVRSTHKLIRKGVCDLIRKGVCDEIKLRPGRANLEPIAR